MSPKSPVPQRFTRRSSRTTARLLLALGVTPLVLSAGGGQIAAVAQARPAGHAAHHRTTPAPRQRWGSAKPEQHVVAKGANHTVPPSSRSLHPLWKAPRTPAPKGNQTRVETAKTVAPEVFDATTSTELPTHRTANERLYRNQDGTLTTEFSATPINYRQADGSFAKIDTRLREKDGWTNTTGAVDVRFAPTADAASVAAVGLDDTHSVSFGLRGAEGRTGSASGSAVRYRKVRTDVDLDLEATGTGAKETLVLHSADAPTTYVFDLHLTGLTLRIDGDAVALLDEQGTERARIPAGFMTDAGTSARGPTTSYGVSYRLTGSADQPALEVTLDRDWLNDPDRAFPVQVDPSVQAGDSGSAMTVHGSSSSTGGQELMVGYQGGSNSAAYLKFDSLVNSLQYHTIFGAQLQIAGYDAPSCKAREVTVNPVTESWSAGTGYSYPGPSTGGQLGKASFAYGYIATGKSSSNCPAKATLIDLGKSGTKLVQRWVNGDQPNYGLSLRAKSGDDSAWKRIAGTSTANAPRLYVTHTPYNADYTIPSPTPNPPVLQNQGSTVKVGVTNRGAETWTPSSYYLAYRLYRGDTTKYVGQYRAATLPGNLARGSKVTLTASIAALPAGSYILDFTMVRSGSKTFTDEQVKPARLILAVFNTPPVLKEIYPDNGYESGTLTPQLWSKAIDLDAVDSSLQFSFEICEVVPSGQTAPACATRAYTKSRSWIVPPGTLKWSKNYKWKTMVKDANGAVVDSGYVALSTNPPQPAVTSKVAGAPYADKGQEFDPQVGNLTTAAVEAPEVTIGPALNVLRTYNSLDPRRDGAFGAGWTTRYDMQAVPDDDGSGNVVIRYPDGQEVRFGRNPDATYSAPMGRSASFTWTTGSGGYLVDQGKTRYDFNADGKLIQIQDVYKRAVVLSYDSAKKLATAQAWNSSTDQQGRKLTFTWNGAHVATVSTDPVNGAPLTWVYTYDGDQLTKVCAPSSGDPICTVYDYTTGSHYRTAVVDDRPEAYYRLGDADDEVATSEVAVNLRKDYGAYTGSSPTAGAIAGSPDTAAALNGTSGVVRVQDSLVKRHRDQAVELWFKTTGNGPLLGYQNKDYLKASPDTPTSGVPALYVGTDGKLRGQFATGTFTPITTTGVVNDGSWHHAVLSASSDTSSSTGELQTLYLDGAKVGDLTGKTINQEALTYDQLGSAYVSTPSSWPAYGTAAKKYFTGSVDEAAFYGRPLGPKAVAAHYAFGRGAANELTKVTLPSGKVASETSYDVATDRVTEYTDRHGGTWKLGPPTVYGNDTDLRRGVQVLDPADRPYLYEFDALAGRVLRTGSPTGLEMRPEDKPQAPATDAPPPSNCSQPTPNDPITCVIEGGNPAGPIFAPLEGQAIRSFGYDADGHQNLITDENGNTTSMTFDARGNAITQTTCRLSTSDCQTGYSTYPATATDPLDPRNTMVTETRDPRSSGPTDNTYLTTYTYDEGGNLLTQKNPGTTHTITHTYTGTTTLGADRQVSPRGLLAKTTDALGGVTTYSYLKNGDLKTVTEPTGLKTTFDYDSLGRKTTETQVSDAYPNGLTSTFGYDALSRMTTMTEPATTDAVTGKKHQRKTAYSYDGDGNVLSTEVSDELGADATRRSTFDFDDFGNLTREVDAEGNETTYGYDRSGNLTSKTDPLDRRYEYGYTARNVLAQSRLWNWNGDPSQAGSTGEYLVLHSYSFDLGGRLLTDTDAMGRKLQYDYNLDNTLKKVTLKGFHNPDGTTRDYVVESRTYDAAGNVLRESGGNNTMATEYTYTVAGQVKTSTTDPDGLSRRTTTTYDDGGNVLSTSSTGKYSNITWPTTSAVDTVEFTYDTAGRQTAQLQTSGSTTRRTTYTYDQRGLTTSVTDPRGNVDGASDVVKKAFTSTFSYDELDRPVQATGPAVDVESNGGAPTTTTPTQVTGYDTFDDVVATKDADGNVGTATVDRLGRPTSRTGAAYTPPGSSTPIVPTSSTIYDPVGNVVQDTDPRGGVTKYAYDHLDRLTARSEPTTDNDTRAVWTYTYSRTGEVLSVTDPLGAQVLSTYDDLDRPVTTTQVETKPVTDNFTTTYGYDDASNATSITSPTGAQTVSSYDTMGQLLQSTDPNGVVTKHGYDYQGREIRLTDGKGRTSRTEYDGFGQVSSESDLSPTGTTLRSQSYGYDPVGNLTSAKNALQTERTYTYDALDRLTKQTEPVTATKSITTSFGYDAAGNRTRYTDGRGNPTITRINPWGLPESVVEPSTTAYPNVSDRTWTLAYDANANPVKLSAPGGVSRTRTFDAADRLTNETGAGTAISTVGRTLGYDAAGQLKSVNTPGGTDTFDYDDRGLMTTASGPSGAASFAYDGDSNLTSRTDAAGTATYTYDKGRLKTEKDGITAATQTLGYDAAGSLETVDYGSGRVRTYTYDDFGRTKSDTLKNTSGGTVSSITYDFDLDDRMTSKVTTGTAGASSNVYGYDLAGRLTSWTKDVARTDYEWDDSGNRTKAGTKTASYDARNRLISDSDYTYTYSPRGTMDGRTSSGSTEPFSFDAFDRLVSEAGTTYTYDGLDRMATRAGVAMQYAGLSDELVGDGRETFAHGAFDELLAVAQGTSKRLTLADQHGDVVGAFDSSNTTLTSLDDSVAFDPFGQVLSSTGTKHDLGFQGDFTDPATGQVDMGARWYTPGTGAFVSRDSAMYSSGPSILANGYTYGAGDPMDNNDPDGNWPSCSFCHKVASGVGHAVSGAGHALASGASKVGHALLSLGSKAWSGIKAAGSKLLSIGKSLIQKGFAAARWLGGKLSSAAKWAGGRISAAFSWGKQKAEAAKKAAKAKARAVTAKAKKVAAAVIKHNPLPALKAALKPLVSGFKTVVSVAANLPAMAVSVTKDRIADLQKATVALYDKAVEKTGVLIDQVSDAFSAIGEFAVSQAPMLLGIAAGALTTGICMVGSFGLGTPGCIVAGFVVGGAVSSALTCAPGRSVAGCAARGGASGLVSGLVTVYTGGTGGAGMAIFSGALSGAAGDATAQLLDGGGVDGGEVGRTAVTDGLMAGLTHGLVRARGGSSEGAAPSCVSPHSFLPGTRVLMADGSSKPIEDVEIGDKVLATDPTTGETSARPVTEVLVGYGDKRMVSLAIDSHSKHGHTIETITATDNHPFWVDGNGDSLDRHHPRSGHWSDAGDLRSGDRLHTPSGGGTVTVMDTRPRAGLRTVYNLTVDGVHTFYIQTGDMDVLVHNACSPSKILGDAMEASGIARPAETDAHHIVAYSAKRADPARAHLKSLGMDLNDPRNGVFLPSNKNSSSVSTGRAVHRSLHTNEYYTSVNDLVTGARNIGEATDVLGYIRGRLEGGGFP